jgi:hypothetical protein
VLSDETTVVVVLAFFTVCVSAVEVLVKSFPLPAYTAITECDPPASVEMLRTAFPLLSVPVPRVVTPSLNVTVPVAALPKLAVTCEVKVTLLP